MARLQGNIILKLWTVEYFIRGPTAGAGENFTERVLMYLTQKRATCMMMSYYYYDQNPSEFNIVVQIRVFII